MNKIYYICSYSNPDIIHEQRYYPPSGATKIDSIIDSLSRLSKHIEIISVSMIHDNSNGNSHYVKLNDYVYLKLFKSYGRKNAVIKLGDRVQLYASFLWYFITNIKKNDTVIVYHSLAYLKMIYLLKKIIGFKLILEVEEIYSDVLGKKNYRDKELGMMNIADGYIYPSYELEKICNRRKKPYVVIHGTYDAEKEIIKCKKRNKEYIHIVYAGTLDIRKGCMETIKAAALLSDKYRVSILGTDKPSNMESIIELIDEVNKKGAGQVELFGKRTGKDYIEFLQSCDIGMCTQDPDAEFTETSFPSKILSYLSNGLRVVSIDIPAVKNSDVADVIYFYNEQTPKAIAECIKSIDLNSAYNSKDKIMKLKRDFIANMENMLMEVEKGQLYD